MAVQAKPGKRRRVRAAKRRSAWAGIRLGQLCTWNAASQVRGNLGAAGFGGHPSKQEEVAAAQFAPVREQDPVDGFLQGVAGAYASELDGSAMRTVGGHNLQ